MVPEGESIVPRKAGQGDRCIQEAVRDGDRGRHRQTQRHRYR